MKKIFTFLFVALLVFVSVSPQNVLAASACNIFSPTTVDTHDSSVTFTMGPTTPGKDYTIRVYWPPTFACSGSGPFTNAYTDGSLKATGNTVSYTFNKGGCNNQMFDAGRSDTHNVSLYQAGASQPICTSSYKIIVNKCKLDIDPKSVDVDTPVKISGSGVFPASTPDGFSRLYVVFSGPYNGERRFTPDASGNFSLDLGKLSSQGTYNITVRVANALIGNLEDMRCSVIPLKVGPPGEPVDNTDAIKNATFGSTSPSEVHYCDPQRDTLSTALGCIPIRDTNQFVGWFLKWALGISGGIAFLLMIIAGFQIMTSTGNPDKIQGGKELLNAAISGLVLIIFSVFLLKLIGVDILGLPGFGS